ncbi:NAD-dependent epimerase/dehydratase family protein [Pseudomonas typographi]|uniref:NAD-dependent epimerase/dehydratase family protein n=1 Tax=Pseudomonas typographi TaxID=2715964 RepID=UPI001686CAF0|nr:NAD-dependent epimerase/dehydratase family protein [Pseudomonas typographi]MBD1585608.1 NAD-dependent epimerase/dehydratase family protein [Pseudomonas typographi]
MNILVTGAGGFIGGRFARVALEQGWSVRACSRRPDSVPPLQHMGAQCLQGDLADSAFAQRLCMGIDTVVHAAGPSDIWAPAPVLQRDILGATENIVEACLSAHVRRLVYVSTADLYLSGRAREQVREKQIPPRQRSLYGRLRFIAEQRVFGAEAFGLQVVVLRPTRIVGAGAGTGQWLPRLLRLHAKGRLQIVGNGLNRVDFTSANNLCLALLLAVRADDAAQGRAFNISNGAPVPLWDALNYVARQLQLPPIARYQHPAWAHAKALLAEAACRAWPGRPRPVITLGDVARLNEDFTLDITRARHDLGYTAPASLWDGLDEFSQGWKALDTSGKYR